jgi:hypothetical protein
MGKTIIPIEKPVVTKPRLDARIAATAVVKTESGTKCLSCGKFVDDDLNDHATMHKTEMLERAKKQRKDPYPLQVLFLEYKNGKVVGRKVF